MWLRCAALFLCAAVPSLGVQAAEADPNWPLIAPFCQPPTAFAHQFGPYKSLLLANNGHEARTASDWAKRRLEIRAYWEKVMGPWPGLLARPRIEYVEKAARDNFVQHRIRLETAPGQVTAGYLLVPEGKGPFPAVFVPYYEPETSIGLGKQELRDFGYQLARRGFVTLSIGSPGGDARRPELAGAQCQPLSFLAYIAANAHTALAQLKEVDPTRIGIVGHSYGGKWAMFSAGLYDKFACGVWSDPGIVFDEARPNVNYWDPWYLGTDPVRQRPLGLPSPERPRIGAYKELVDSGHDLHELLGLMAPRPFLVSGGSEDPPARWQALNRVLEVYQLLGADQRVFLTSRKDHTPTPESNAQIYAFFEHFLKGSGPVQSALLP
jgi:hypothetical protein